MIVMQMELAGEAMRYDKGHKDASRRRIMEVAGERFRSDGIAAAGLAGIMKDAGLTNGAFYPHFRSKAELVRESVATAMESQADQMGKIMSAGGVEAAIAQYLSPEHRDRPANGCTLAALLPELARQPSKDRRVYAERLRLMAGNIASKLPGQTDDPESRALAIYAILVGTLQLARAVEGADLSDRILAAGKDAALALVRN
jgi:TetR/AcrR family transcriptional repressor of nem operon